MKKMRKLLGQDDDNAGKERKLDRIVDPEVEGLWRGAHRKFFKTSDFG